MSILTRMGQVSDELRHQFDARLNAKLIEMNKAVYDAPFVIDNSRLRIRPGVSYVLNTSGVSLTAKPWAVAEDDGLYDDGEGVPD